MPGTPRARPNQLKAQWANTADGGSDLHYFWGDGVPKCDSRLLHNALTQKAYSPLTREWDMSLYEELEARGYDLQTLRFSISKRPIKEASQDG